MSSGCPTIQKGEDCTKAGIGASCGRDPEPSENQKKLCLKNARDQCDKLYTNGAKKCEEQFERDEESRTQAETRTIFDDKLWLDRNFEKLCDCYSSAYTTVANTCNESHCYCNLPMCKQPCSPTFCGPNGMAGGGVKPPKPASTNKDDNALKDASFTTGSAYGVEIELVYTRAYMPGNVIYCADPKTVITTNHYTTYDPNANTYTVHTVYGASDTLSWATGLCAGEIDALSRLWVAQGLVFDRSGSSQVTVGNGSTFKFYSGTESQKVSELQVSQYGFGKVPAYRGLCYVEVLDLPITNLTTFPEVLAEVVKVSDSNFQEVKSDDFPGYSVISIDPDAKRVFLSSGTQVAALDYETLEAVGSETVADVVEMTTSGKMLSYDGNTLSIFDPQYDTAQASRLADLTIAETFILRTRTSGGNSFNTILSMSSTGDIDMDYYDDSTDAFYQSIDTISPGGNPASVAVNATLYRDSGNALIPFHDFSIVLARVNDAGDGVNLIELPMASSDTTATDFVDGGFFSLWDVDNAIYDGASDVEVRGIVPCKTDGSLILFTFGNGFMYAQKWTKAGIAWTSAIPENAFLNKYSAMFDVSSTKYSYVADDANVYSLDFETGGITLVTPTTEDALGPQLYDPETDSITFSNGTTITRTFLNRVNTTKQSLTEVVKDILARSGVDMVVDGDNSSVFVTGYRSGNKTKGGDMIQDLLALYPSILFDGDKVYLQNKGFGDVAVVAQDDANQQFTFSTDRSVGDTRQCSETYYSDPLFGEQVTQTFLLPSEKTTDYQIISDTFTAIESDEYMMRLAELTVFSAQEGDVTTGGLLGWKWLAMTPGDFIDILPRQFEVQELTIGADNTVEFKGITDSAAKYSDVVPLSVISPLQFDGRTITSDDPLSAPIGVITYPIESAQDGVAGAIIGASDFWGEFDSQTGLSITQDPSSDSVGVLNKKVSNPAVWGRLSVAPPDLPTAQWRSFPTHSFQVVFPTAEIAQAVVNNAYFTAEFDYNFLLRDVWTNLVLVGKELIQFTTATLGDTRTVVFSGLSRARCGTEVFGTHEAGELVMILNKADYLRAEISYDDVLKNVMALSYSPDGRTRHNDIPPFAPAYAPWQPSGVTAQAITATGSNRNFSHPDNPHFIFRCGGRVQNANILTPIQSSINFNGASEIALYVVHGEYDQTTFDAALVGDPSDESYIMTRQTIADNRSFVQTGSVYYNQAVIWSATSQPSDWDYANEEVLTIVLEAQYTNVFDDPIPKNRLVVKWPIPGEYFTRPTRGLYVYG